MVLLTLQKPFSIAYLFSATPICVFAAVVGDLAGDVEVTLHDGLLQAIVLTELRIPEITDAIADDGGLAVVLVGKTTDEVLEVVEVHSAAQVSFGDCILLGSATVPKATAESEQKDKNPDTTISPIVFIFGYGSDVRQAHVIHDSHEIIFLT